IFGFWILDLRFTRVLSERRPPARLESKSLPQRGTKRIYYQKFFHFCAFCAFSWLILPGRRPALRLQMRFFQRPFVATVGMATAVGCKKSTAVLPEQRPDL